MQKTSGKWHGIPLPKGFSPTKSPDFVSTDNGIVLFTQDTFFSKRCLFIYRNGNWREFIPSVPRGDFSDFGWRRYLFDAKFFVGFSGDEWNTGVEVFNINHPSEGWDDYSHDLEFVTSFTIDSKNRLWSCSESWMGGADFLHRYDGSNWQHIGDYPGAPDVQVVTTGPHGKIYTAGYDGVYRWESDRPAAVLKLDFSAIRKQPLNPITGQYEKEGVLCDPLRIAFDSSENIFLATNSYGFLCFIKDGSRYHLKQVMTPRELQESNDYFKSQKK